MTALKTEDAIDEQNSASALEAGIGNLIRGEVETRQPPSEAVSELNVEGLTSLITRVSGHSASQIDSLIAELNEVRNYLRAEGKRIQREISQYALMNQSAMTSTKIISDALGPWKTANFDKQPSGTRLGWALTPPHKNS
jgi:hypothetical protein